MPRARLTRTFLAVALASAFVPRGLTAQLGPGPVPEDSSPGTRVFGSLGVGAGTLGVAGLLYVSVRTAVGDVIARLAATGGATPLFTPSDDVSDAALLFGRLHEGDSRWLRLAAGPGYVESTRVGPARDCFFFACIHDTTRSSAVGLALQAEVGTSPGSWLGLTLTGFANLNSERSFGGVTLSLRLGRAARPGATDADGS